MWLLLSDAYCLAFSECRWIGRIGYMEGAADVRTTAALNINKEPLPFICSILARTAISTWRFSWPVKKSHASDAEYWSYTAAWTLERWVLSTESVWVLEPRLGLGSSLTEFENHDSISETYYMRFKGLVMWPFPKFLWLSTLVAAMSPTS